MSWTLIRIHETLSQVTLASLEHLAFGQKFNQSLEVLPKSLKSLSLGLDFQQSLQDVNFPLGIQKLTLQSPVEILEAVELPSGLDYLNFGDGFNDTLDQVQFPGALKTLTFGDDFNQSLEQPGGGLSLFKPQNSKPQIGRFYDHETTTRHRCASYVDPASPSYCCSSFGFRCWPFKNPDINTTIPGS